ncbi:MAG TPA: sigma-70 family RNA polymerase sigma factor [Acidobacteriota bacterium]|nr:sigma-70 family RNA polymerase sigma factor [Acidobacteriota bacterium]
MELQTLLSRCRAGDEIAWEALVRRYQGRVFAVAHHYLRDPEEARDVAQETFVHIYKGLSSFNRGGSFLAWAVRIARNASIDRLRYLKARPALGGALVDDELAGPDSAPGPEASSISGERRHVMRRAIDQMSPINREMILLKEIQGLKQREISDLLSIPLGTVKARANRARLELARRVLELDPSFGI